MTTASVQGIKVNLPKASNAPSLAKPQTKAITITETERDKSLPEKLRETAYALACDVAAADGTIAQEELRLLEIIRHELRVGRLPAAAIERGARARHTVL